MATPCGVAPQLRGKPLRSGQTYTTSWDINDADG
jgi:hypothetical protein